MAMEIYMVMIELYTAMINGNVHNTDMSKAALDGILHGRARIVYISDNWKCA